MNIISKIRMFVTTPEQTEQKSKFNYFMTKNRRTQRSDKQIQNVLVVFYSLKQIWF